MGKPTPEQTKEMQYRKLVKETWEREFNRARDEFTHISLGRQFMKIRTGGKEIDIHRNLFEDYFAAVSKKSETICLERIKKYLEQLL